MRECLRAGADPNGPPGVYPLPPLFVAAARSPHPAVIRVLVDAGADVAAREWGDLTPLHEAAGQNTNAGVTAALLDVGADPNARDRDGIAPLHLAATDNSNPDVVTFLIEAGADPNTRDPYGNTPLHLAWADSWFDRRPVMRELLRLGADPLARNDAGEIAEPTHCDNWNTGYFAYSALPADYVRCLDAGCGPQRTRRRTADVAPPGFGEPKPGGHRPVAGRWRGPQRCGLAWESPPHAADLA